MPGWRVFVTVCGQWGAMRGFELSSDPTGAVHYLGPSPRQHIPAGSESPEAGKGRLSAVVPMGVGEGKRGLPKGWQWFQSTLCIHVGIATLMPTGGPVI